MLVQSKNIGKRNGIFKNMSNLLVNSLNNRSFGKKERTFSKEAQIERRIKTGKLFSTFKFVVKLIAFNLKKDWDRTE